jgi:hypothetical protein
MKNIIFLILSLFLTLKSTAQNDNSGAYKNWVVDYTKSRSSFEGVQLDKIELNDNYTIAYMSFHNWGFGIQHIEACNTFHIRSKGKKIANFVKAQNIPTRNVDKIGFSCADEESSMKIKPGQFVRFRIYFTRIPEYLNTIDIIEYDGYRPCEFDIFNLNISKKEPLPSPQQSIAMIKPLPKKVVPPPVVEKQEKTIVQQSKPEKPKPQTVKPPLPLPKPKEEEPVIASKTVPKPEKKVVLPITKIENREIAIRKEYQVKIKVLQLELWDNDKEDGDQVSIMLNNRWVLRGVAVTKNKKKFEFPLQMGENVLTFHADNLGTAPPNTAAIKFFDGSDEQTIILNSDMDKSEAIRLIRN